MCTIYESSQQLQQHHHASPPSSSSKRNQPSVSPLHHALCLSSVKCRSIDKNIVSNNIEKKKNEKRTSSSSTNYVHKSVLSKNHSSCSPTLNKQNVTNHLVYDSDNDTENVDDDKLVKNEFYHSILRFQNECDNQDDRNELGSLVETHRDVNFCYVPQQNCDGTWYWVEEYLGGTQFSMTPVERDYVQRGLVSEAKHHFWDNANGYLDTYTNNEDSEDDDNDINWSFVSDTSGSDSSDDNIDTVTIKDPSIDKHAMYTLSCLQAKTPHNEGLYDFYKHGTDHIYAKVFADDVSPFFSSAAREAFMGSNGRIRFNSEEQWKDLEERSLSEGFTTKCCGIYMRVYTFRVRQLMKQILVIEALRDVVDGSIQYQGHILRKMPQFMKKLKELYTECEEDVVVSILYIGKAVEQTIEDRQDHHNNSLVLDGARCNAEFNLCFGRPTRVLCIAKGKTPQHINMLEAAVAINVCGHINGHVVCDAMMSDASALNNIQCGTPPNYIWEENCSRSIKELIGLSTQYPNANLLECTFTTQGSKDHFRRLKDEIEGQHWIVSRDNVIDKVPLSLKNLTLRQAHSVLSAMGGRKGGLVTDDELKVRWHSKHLKMLIDTGMTEEEADMEATVYVGNHL